MKEELGGKWR